VTKRDHAWLAATVLKAQYVLKVLMSFAFICYVLTELKNAAKALIDNTGEE
jgi:hypothetical protein